MNNASGRHGQEEQGNEPTARACLVLPPRVNAASTRCAPNTVAPTPMTASTKDRDADLETHAVVRTRHRVAVAPGGNQELARVHEVVFDSCTSPPPTATAPRTPRSSTIGTKKMQPSRPASATVTTVQPTAGDADHAGRANGRCAEPSRDRAGGARRSNPPIIGTNMSVETVCNSIRTARASVAGTARPRAGFVPQLQHRQDRPRQPPQRHELRQRRAHVYLRQVIRRVGEGQAGDQRDRRREPAPGQAVGPRCAQQESQRPGRLGRGRKAEPKQVKCLANVESDRRVEQEGRIAEPDGVVGAPDGPQCALLKSCDRTRPGRRCCAARRAPS